MEVSNCTGSVLEYIPVTVPSMVVIEMTCVTVDETVVITGSTVLVIVVVVVVVVSGNHVSDVVVVVAGVTVSHVVDAIWRKVEQNCSALCSSKTLKRGGGGRPDGGRMVCLSPPKKSSLCGGESHQKGGQTRPKCRRKRWPW